MGPGPEISIEAAIQTLAQNHSPELDPISQKIIEHHKHITKELELSNFLKAIIARAFFLKNIFSKNSELIKNIQLLQKTHAPNKSYIDWLLECWEEYSKQEAKNIEKLENMLEQFKQEDLKAAEEILNHRIHEIRKDLESLKNEEQRLQGAIDTYEQQEIPLLESIYDNNNKEITRLREQYRKKLDNTCISSIPPGLTEDQKKSIALKIQTMLENRIKDYFPGQNKGPFLPSQTKQYPLGEILSEVKQDQNETAALEKEIQKKMDTGFNLLIQIESEILSKEEENAPLKRRLDYVKRTVEELKKELNAVKKEEEILEKEEKELKKLLSGIHNKLETPDNSSDTKKRSSKQP